MNKIPLNIVIKDSDYHHGDGQLKLTGITTEKWGKHFNFFVPQSLSDGDTDDCWDFGGIKNVDAFIDALITEGKIPSAVVQQFTDWGFMDIGIDGLKHFHSSPRFPAILSGVGRNGGNTNMEYDITRKNGLVPFTLLPVNKNMTLAGYFDPKAITQEMRTIATSFLSLMGGKNFLQYQWIVSGGATNVPKMAATQSDGPFTLGIPVDVNGWNQVHPTIATGQAVHVVSGYDVDLPNLAVLISDNYNPYLKVLDNGYQISYVEQVIVQYIPPPPTPVAPTTQPVTPTPTNPTPKQNSAWLVYLNALTEWLNGLLNSVQGKVGSNATTMSDIFLLNWKDVGKGVLMAALTVLVTGAYQVIVACTTFDCAVSYNWYALLQAGVLTGVAYLLKQLLTDSNGNVLGIGSPKGGEIIP